MKKVLLPLLLWVFGLQVLWAQPTPPSNLEGDNLKEWLRQNWYNGYHKNLGYSTARGYMYNYIDNYNNKVTCVYTGYQDNKTFSTTGTSTSMTSINCEHTVPQSFFSEGEPMKSDIHHLFPTHSSVNSTRSNYPFSDIDDTRTSKWHIGDASGYYTSSNIPSTNIDAYSESYSGTFEPREDHKGNVARAIFYFYTMYPSQAGAISRVGNLSTLYAWHLQDPVDDRERERNTRTAEKQGNRNPYIDYPDLVAKAYGLAPVNCEPSTQIANLIASEKSTTSATLTWANGNGNSRLIVIKQGDAANFTPTGAYTSATSDFDRSTDAGNGYRAVYSGNSNTVTINGLAANTTYHIRAYEFCTSGNNYNATNAPALSFTTPDYSCTGTPGAITGIGAANITQTGFALTWANGSGDGRIVVLREGEAATFLPAEGTNYTGANADVSKAESLSDGSKLIYAGAGSTVAVTGLSAGKVYYATLFERCSNGYRYASGASFAVTTEASNIPTPPSGGNLIAIQTFDGTATDGWAITRGFDTSDNNSGTPSGQRIRSGKSLQVAGTTREVEFAEMSVAGREDVYLELYNSSVSETSGNGFDNSDSFKVYVALDGNEFSATPDILISADQPDNQVRYGYTGTATLVTTAGTPLEKIFVKTDGGANTLADELAPSKLQVLIPSGTSTVKVKLVIGTNNSKEIWCVEDVALFAAATSTDCDAEPLEDFAGNDATVCADGTLQLGKAAQEGYTYSWSPAAGLSDASVAAPIINNAVPGTYTYTVTATKGACTYQDEVTVTVSAALARPMITQNGPELTASTDGEAYEWLKDGKVIATATTKVITVTEAGTYTVRVRNSSGCYSANSEAVAVSLQPNAVPDAAQVGISIYPNPTAGKLLLYTKQPLQRVQVLVLNSLGQVVYTKHMATWQQQQELNLQHLPQGLYFVHVKAAELQAVQRVVLAK